jgi:hypothetical protein
VTLIKTCRDSAWRFIACGRTLLAMTIAGALIATISPCVAVTADAATALPTNVSTQLILDTQAGTAASVQNVISSAEKNRGGGCNGDGTGSWEDNSNANFALCVDTPESYVSVDISAGLLEHIYASMGGHVVVRKGGTLEWVWGRAKDIAAVIGGAVALFIQNHPLAAIAIAVAGSLMVLVGGAVALYKYVRGVIYSIRGAKHAVGAHFHVDMDTCVADSRHATHGCPIMANGIGWWNEITSGGPWGKPGPLAPDPI